MPAANVGYKDANEPLLLYWMVAPVVAPLVKSKYPSPLDGKKTLAALKIKVWFSGIANMHPGISRAAAAKLGNADATLLLNALWLGKFAVIVTRPVAAPLEAVFWLKVRVVAPTAETVVLGWIFNPEMGWPTIVAVVQGQLTVSVEDELVLVAFIELTALPPNGYTQTPPGGIGVIGGYKLKPCAF